MISLEIEKVDVRGRACPMPIVLIKRKLEGTETGQTLEVTGDCGPAFENIQRWAKNAGHEVLEALKSGTEFTIRLKKH